MSRAVIAAMTAYTLELRHAEVKLNQNESPFDLPPSLKQEALARVAERPWNIYPDFESLALREAIARAEGLDAQNVLVGNGSNELLAAVREHEAAVVIVCSPNNPTGGVLPAGGVEALLATGATLLLDRAYGDFDVDADVPPPAPNLVTFRTFSKAWGLAALRIGWLMSTAANCAEVRKVKLPYSLNIVSEAIAVAALGHPELRDANVAATIAERARMLEAMRAIDGVTPFPTRANFIAFRTRCEAKSVFEALHARGILVRDISSAPRMQQSLRVSIGTVEQNDRFLATLKEIA